MCDLPGLSICFMAQSQVCESLFHLRVASSASVGATVSWEGLLCVCDRPAFEDLSHNSSLEAVGFVSLFLPSTLHIDGDVDTPLLTRYCEF